MAEIRPLAPQLIEFGPEHSAELTLFDRAQFAGFHEVADDFYPMIFDSGAVVAGHVNEQDAIVSVAALYLHPTLDLTMPLLEQQLPPWAGFLDGAAVSPPYRKSRAPHLDLHRDLLQWRNDKAQASGKTATLSAVRSNNGPSLDNLYWSGFHALADATGYYGTRPEDDRIVGAIPLGQHDTVSWPNPPSPISPIEIDALVSNQPETVTLRAHKNEANPYFFQAVSRLLRNEYVSYGRFDDPASAIPSKLMAFTRLEASAALQGGVKSRLLEIRPILQELCGRTSK